MEPESEPAEPEPELEPEPEPEGLITYIVNLNTNDLHIKLSKTDKSNQYLTGYLGKKNNKVYFVSDRDYNKYNFSFSSIKETDMSNNTTFDTNTLLNMSLYNYGLTLN